MNITRLLRHLLIPRWHVRRAFPARTLDAIENAIRRAESHHDGQICFAVESALEIAPLLQRRTPRQRAIDVFSQLRIWDTERNNGVLIYLLLADRNVEIVADRGISQRVDAKEWERICGAMERSFSAGQFESGVIAGIDAVSAHLSHHFPSSGPRTNDIPDRPIVL